MMIRAAGGPGLISPLDYGERKGFRFNRNTWIAIGVVTLAHIGVGVAIYYQRFELKAAPLSPDIINEGVMIDLPRPEIKPLEPVETIRPPAPNAPIHQSPLPQTPTETFTAAVSDTAATAGPITIAVPVPVGPVTDAAPVADPPRPPAVITRPRWASQPSAAQLTRAYPARAIENGVSGTASLNCLVSASGTLSNCSVTSQTPPSAGFGRAAESLTRYFQMSPGTVDGQPIDGARVAFTVRFAVSD